MTSPDMAVMHQVLHEVRFPAHRWQLIAAAEWYGADIVTRHRLRELPARPYHDCADVTGELAAVVAMRIRQRLRHRAGNSDPGHGSRSAAMSDQAH